MKTYTVAVLPGDGIGPEITKQAVEVLEKASQRFGFEVQVVEALIGGCAYNAEHSPLPESTVEVCKNANAVLLGAVGGPEWDALEGKYRPEAGLLRIRKELGLFANLRPAILYPELRNASPLKDSILEDGLDLLVVRELTGGIYFGDRGQVTVDGYPAAYDTETYSLPEIERILHVAFSMAQQRKKRLCSVDKANVLASSRLWRETAEKISLAYPDVELTHMYVDNAAMQLVRHPRQFDTIVTTNMFGDILSDEASQITGSIGMLPSASLGQDAFGLYEPIHGSAPDIAGKDIANPLASILSVAMMLRYTFHEMEAADCIEQAVGKVLQQGVRTADLAEPDEPIVGTQKMGSAVVKAMEI